LSQIGTVEDAIARGIAIHVDLWLVRRKDQALRWSRGTGGQDVTMEDSTWSPSCFSRHASG
jgi:hypothetical protein